MSKTVKKPSKPTPELKIAGETDNAAPSSSANRAKVNKEFLRENEKKWTPELMEAGRTVIPSAIIEHQHALGLKPVDLSIIAQLAKHWWYADRLPYPSKKSIGASIGVDPRTVQRRIAAMEKAGLLKRVQRRTLYGDSDTNVYSFEGLIAKARPYAEEMAKEKAQRQAASARRKNSGAAKAG